MVAQRCRKLAVLELIRPEPISSVVLALVRLNLPFESDRTADTAISIKRRNLSDSSST